MNGSSKLRSGRTASGGDVLNRLWGSAAIALWVAAAGASQPAGAAPGPYLVKDIYAGPESNPGQREITFVPGTQSGFFLAGDPNWGDELWKTDGSEAGTYRVQDLVPGFAGVRASWPSLENRGTVYFSAEEGLWRSDGTPEGISLVSPFASWFLAAAGDRILFLDRDDYQFYRLRVTQNEWAEPVELMEFGSITIDIWEPAVMDGRVYFGESGNLPQTNLWVSDGTVEGTTFLAELPGDLLTFVGRAGNNLFFLIWPPPVGTDDPETLQMWRTDGTSEGTILLTGQLTQASEFTTFGGLLLFTGHDWAHGREPWVSNGTPEGTHLLRDFSPGTSWGIGYPDYAYDSLNRPASHYVVLSGAVYFFANDDVHGRELWKTDGTEEGTVLVKDIVPGDADSNPSLPVACGARRVFAADDTTSHGRELWVSDGTPEGTVLGKDIFPGLSSSNPDAIVPLGDNVYFSADDGTHGRELWMTSGTPDGIWMVQDINAGEEGSDPLVRTEVAGKVYLDADDGVHGRELWVTDGRPAETRLVKDINPPTNGSSDLMWPFDLNGTLLFFASDSAHGTEPWRSDGTAEGTQLLNDLDPGTSSSMIMARFSGTEPWVQLNGAALFLAGRKGIPNELWRSDGTATGTWLVKELAPPDEFGIPPDQYYERLYSTLNRPCIHDGKAYFLYFDRTVNAIKLVVTDGTAEGTTLITLGYHDSGWVAATSSTVFVGTWSDSPVPEFPPMLWITDGTSTGTVVIQDQFNADPIFAFLNPYPLGDTLFFMVYGGTGENTLWKSDGTGEGTVAVMTFTSPGGPIGDAGGRVLLPIAAPDQGEELWASDGTPQRTVLVKDIWPGPIGSALGGFVAFRNGYLFVADDGIHGGEPWYTDGSPEGTRLVWDVRPGPLGSFPGGYFVPFGSEQPRPQFFVAGDQAYFTTDDGVHGWELWCTDGTPDGTRLVRDLFPGWRSSVGQILTIHGHYAFCAATDGVTGYELWMSDGTPYGTVPLSDAVTPGAASSNPSMARVAGDLLYFTADNNTGLGRELWAIPMDQLPAPDPMAGDILRRLLGKPCNAEPVDQTGEGELDVADFIHVIQK